ncbi:hypothetical protein SDC9_149361 [bioreactor metagenome]|uniref:Uncharacterized protein n=1 Tax=bioreactor metagenome TaxID=1076179 RepID=A0A645EJF7_9ZZZZ
MRLQPTRQPLGGALEFVGIKMHRPAGNDAAVKPFTTMAQHVETIGDMHEMPSGISRIHITGAGRAHHHNKPLTLQMVGGIKDFGRTAGFLSEREKIGLKTAAGSRRHLLNGTKLAAFFIPDPDSVGAPENFITPIEKGDFARQQLQRFRMNQRHIGPDGTAQSMPGRNSTHGFNVMRQQRRLAVLLREIAAAGTFPAQIPCLIAPQMNQAGIGKKLFVFADQTIHENFKFRFQGTEQCPLARIIDQRVAMTVAKKVFGVGQGLQQRDIAHPPITAVGENFGEFPFVQRFRRGNFRD